MLKQFAGHNPWHVCFAVGLCWGRLARLTPEFVGPAVRLLTDWNNEDLKLARSFHYERGSEPIEQSLAGGHAMFASVRLPEQLPDNLDKYRRAQDRWLGHVLGPDRPRYIGSWNATAIFMVGLFSNKSLAEQLTTPVVMLPPGGPVYKGLSILHDVHLLSRKPAGGELDDQAFEPGAIYENNALFEELLKGRAGWSLLDVHSGLYMLGTRLAESDKWF